MGDYRVAAPKPQKSGGNLERAPIDAEPATERDGGAARRAIVRTDEGGTRPTIAGREFLASAHHILAETDAALRKLKTRSRGENGLLKIGVYASLSTGNLFATLLDHHRAFPDVEVHTVDGRHDQLLCALTNNTIDVAITTNSRLGWGNRILPLWSERVIVALHAEHRLSKLDLVQWSDLAGEPILIPESGPGPELERLLDRTPQQLWPPAGAAPGVQSRPAAKSCGRRVWRAADVRGRDGRAVRPRHLPGGPRRRRRHTDQLRRILVSDQCQSSARPFSRAAAPTLPGSFGRARRSLKRAKSPKSAYARYSEDTQYEREHGWRRKRNSEVDRRLDRRCAPARRRRHLRAPCCRFRYVRRTTTLRASWARCLSKVVGFFLFVVQRSSSL